MLWESTTAQGRTRTKHSTNVAHDRRVAVSKSNGSAIFIDHNPIYDNNQGCQMVKQKYVLIKSIMLLGSINIKRYMPIEEAVDQ